ncbi:hypothetical protein KO516_05850 [Citreicella sp. C3M06]|uniref:hypothetical protein n=1 Tax=Citreicella sp. C3M06 TaxID=2841564 RepID=UPI001C0A5CCB|nr:hypothetical protein [Citreicella sp. C3M06]MBU2960349.1 hypothetical protein [Citreicella sp. C3M06]
MGGNEPIRDAAQHCIALPCNSDLVSKDLPVSAFPDTRQTDAEGLENPPDMALEIFVQVD